MADRKDRCAKHCHAHKVLEQLRRLPADVVLVAGDGGKVDADRRVLAASSEYFKVLFFGPWAKLEDEVPVENSNTETLRSLVDFCYVGTLQLSADNIGDVLATASFLLMDSVIHRCCVYLTRQLEASNCVAILNLAEMHQSSALQRLAREYIYVHYLEVSRCPEFLELPWEQLTTLLASSQLNVASEEIVLQSLVSWWNHDKAERSKQLKKLLALVRLPLLDNVFAMTQIDDEAFQCLLMEAVEQQKSASKDESQAVVRRERCSALLLLGGHYRVSHSVNQQRIISKNIKHYCGERDEWLDWNELPDQRYWFGAAYLREELIIVGGRDDNKIVETAHSLNLRTLEWTTLQPLHTKRSSLCLAVLDEMVYAIGGAGDGRQQYETVERWDPKERTWQFVAPMQAKRAWAGSAVLNGRLYVAGGGDDQRCLSSVECYNSQTNIWSRVAPMNKARRDFGIAASRDAIYVVGGLGITKTVECYSSKENRWIFLASIRDARCGLTCAYYEQRLFAVGGYCDTSTDAVEQYDTSKGEWQALKSFEAGISSPVAIVIPKVYVDISLLR